MTAATPTPASDAAADSGAGPDARSWPAEGAGWVVAGLLALASIVSQFDRTVVNLTVAPLKATFRLNDTEFGMLQGVAFGAFYVVACIPIGRLADRWRRGRLISASLVLFSLFSMGSGLTRSFAQLFLTRVGVAVGEASVTPAGMSLLSDSFPPQRLGRPAGAFLMSAPVGQGLAFILGGSLLQWLTTSAALQSGPLAGLAPWQAAFLIVGAPGLLIAPLFLLLREPARRGAGAAAPLSLREVLSVFRQRLAALAPMFAGFSMVTLVNYAFFIWTPALFERSYGWTAGQVGVGFGLIVLIFGSSGALFAGWLTDVLSRRGRLDAPLKVAAFGFGACGLFGALAALAPSPIIALALLAPAIFLSMSPFPCAAASIQLITPNRARGQLTAVYITLTTLVGLVIGPMVVGLMTDFVFRNPADIRYALAIVVGLPAPVMFALLMMACRPYRALRAAAP